MATVTGFTAARMLAIENASIVDGEIVGDDLILTRFDETTINAGNVRGPTGSPGVSEEQFAIALPAGMIIDYIDTTPPEGWLAMTGQTIVGGETLYPDLWDKLPILMKSGSNIVMPDTRGRVSVGYHSGNVKFDVIGETGGTETHTLTQAELPNATITINPPPTSVPIDPPGVDISGSVYMASPSAGGTGVAIIPLDVSTSPTSVESATDWNANIAPFVSTVDIDPFASGPLGSGAAHNNLQPYVVFLKIIKAV